MRRRIAAVILGVFFFGLLGFLLLSWRRAIAPIERPGPASFAANSIANGELLAAEGHCVSCHIRPGGQPFAGGYGVKTPFGVIYGTNITPDPQTGIGHWSFGAFNRAMREGVARDGSHLFPAFPYYSYTKLSDNDMRDLYAYLMTRPAVSATVPKNTIPFPLSIRALEEGWKILFFRSGRFQPNTVKSAEWNRGAYLAEVLSDCTGCHTPRNPLGAEESKRAYAGYVVEGWIAPPLTEANPSPVPWTLDDLYIYLRTGVSRLHSRTDATMTPVIRDGLALPVVPDSDVRAIVLYFSGMDNSAVHNSSVQAIEKQALATSALGSGQEYDLDAELYASACMSCHYNSGLVQPARPELALLSAVTLPEPTNFIQVTLHGVGSQDGAPGMFMPAYDSSLSDAQIARLAAYVRRTRTTAPPWKDLEKKVAEIRRHSTESH
jgi:mono/diheme cytochrome c family protein